MTRWYYFLIYPPVKLLHIPRYALYNSPRGRTSSALDFLTRVRPLLQSRRTYILHSLLVLLTPRWNLRRWKRHAIATGPRKSLLNDARTEYGRSFSNIPVDPSSRRFDLRPISRTSPDGSNSRNNSPPAIVAAIYTSRIYILSALHVPAIYSIKVPRGGARLRVRARNREGNLKVFCCGRGSLHC